MRFGALNVTLLCALSVPLPAVANNLSITNVTLGNVGGGTAEIVFDANWDNSWRASWTANGSTPIENWDAAWLFAKYRVADGLWKPVRLASSGHTAPTGSEIVVCSNGSGTNVGALVHRSSAGSGAFALNDLALKWDLAASGLAGTSMVDVCVIGIEMVYVPGGAFHVGGGGGSGPFYTAPVSGTSYLIGSEGEIEVGSTTGLLWYEYGYNQFQGHNTGDRGSPIPASFPKGFASFYCMKYEITQGQYAQFLNLAEPGVAVSLFPNQSSQRHTISVSDGVYTAAAPDLACNWIGSTDVARYLDWASLRPMTEFEYEKSCRGPLVPVMNEFAWGDSLATLATGLAGTDGSGSETATPADANVHGSSTIGGPIRVGIFARGSSSRRAAGAGYYGAMDLTGNVAEHVITVGNPEGRAFAGEHGDGNEVNGAPPYSSATGLRGGSFHNPHGASERYHAAWPYGRAEQVGGRGVRTAP